jgi:NAD(P)-dependent dehydrogenase (short-subunit alcohol dehydrogenase family)
MPEAGPAAAGRAPVALVTGASRGIGKACAVALAGAGFDVAVAARTVRPGEAREHSVTVFDSDTRPLPGSLEETAGLIEAAGRRSLTVPMDLTDRASVTGGMDRLLEAWGPPELLVHNGRYVGPGMMDLILDTPIEAYDNFLEAHVIAQLVLTKMALPGMLERGRGTIMTMGSGAGFTDPPAPAGRGGWGLGYAIAKAASHRLVGHLVVEHPEIRAFNIDPGYVSTERNRFVADGFDHSTGAPPAAIGAVVAWLATDPDSEPLRGTMVDAQALCRARRLYAF